MKWKYIFTVSSFLICFSMQSMQKSKIFFTGTDKTLLWGSLNSAMQCYFYSSHTEGELQKRIAQIKEDLPESFDFTSGIYNCHKDHTDLMLAAKYNAVKVAHTILSVNKKYADCVGANKRTALHWAASNGSTEVLKLLLKETPHLVNKKDENHNTPLFNVESVDIARILIEGGANVNERCNAGNTPLHVAHRFGRIEMKNLLLAHGAKTDIQNDAGEMVSDSYDKKENYPKKSDSCVIL